MLRLLLIPSVILLASCTNQMQLISEQGRVVRPSDFVRQVEIAPQIEEDLVATDNTEQAPPEANEAVEVAEDVIGLPMPETEDFMMPSTVGVPMTVEALVGQVNGSPIYANAVLEPISDQLWTYAKTMSRSEFSDKVRSTLYFEAENMGTTFRGGQLYELVITDLLLSEARSGMSKEQTYGLFAIVGQMRQDLASAQGGSQTQMRHNIEEQSGASVDDFLESQRDQILIEALHRQKIWPRVNVTWRDIQREFESLSQNFSSEDVEEDPERIEAILMAMQKGVPLGDIKEAKGSVTLGMIRVPKDNAKAEVVQDSFKNGLTFAQVADLVGTPRSGEWETFEMGLGGPSDIDVSDIIKKQLDGAVEGEILQPFELGSNLVWVSILYVQKPVSIYNQQIQITLRNMLSWVKFNKEKGRFVESLWGDGSLDEVKAMVERVANIAVRRYQH